VARDAIVVLPAGVSDQKPQNVSRELRQDQRQYVSKSPHMGNNRRLPWNDPGCATRLSFLPLFFVGFDPAWLLTDGKTFCRFASRNAPLRPAPSGLRLGGLVAASAASSAASFAARLALQQVFRGERSVLVRIAKERKQNSIGFDSHWA
jgi:hypothetical protein